MTLNSFTPQAHNSKTGSFQSLKAQLEHIGVPTCQGMSRRKNEMFFFSHFLFTRLFTDNIRICEATF